MNGGDKRKPDGTYPVENVTDEDLHLALKTWSASDVAALFGVSRQTIWRWRNRPSYLKFQAEIAADAWNRVRAEVESDLKLALSTARQVCTSEDDHAALQGARFLVETHRRVEQDAREAQVGPSVSEDSREELLERIHQATKSAVPGFTVSPVQQGGSA